MRVMRSCALAAVLGAAAGIGLNATAVGQVTLTDHRLGSGLFTAFHDPVETVIPAARERMIGGMAVGDFNNDGHQDIFWLGGGGVPDKLYINTGTGLFLDQAAAWGIDAPHCGSGASVGDFNGDGYLDIYITSFGPPDQQPAQPGFNRLYMNNGGTSFTDVAVAAGVNFTSPTAADGYGSAWGDYDLDGDLDLMVTTHTTAFGDPIQSNGNRLYRNNGDSTFTDVTADAGIAESLDGVRGFQPVFHDIDGDLYPEILLAADFTTSRYFINNRDGTFTDYTAPSGTGLDANGMGQAVADLDRDGLWDWYVTSIHLEGAWNALVPGTGNMLYMGLGNHEYDERSVATGTNDGGWGWGTVAVDLDQDGWQELLEVNGWQVDIFWIGERGKLFYNNANGTFTEMAVTAGFNTTLQGRGLVFLDADLDGDLDIAVGNNTGPVDYFRNDSDTGNWIRILFDTSNNALLPPNGYNTKATVTIDGQSQMRYLSGSPSYLATSELALHFGLGAAETIDELRIDWSRGQVTVLNDVAVNQHLTITSPKLGDIDGDGSVGINDFLALLAAWGPVEGVPDMPIDLDADNVIGIGDFLILLANWG